MLSALSRLHTIFGGPFLDRFLRTPRLRRRVHGWLITEVLHSELSLPDDITVLIGIRNRFDYRIVNAVRSIRAQTHPPSLVRILVVDYGSEAEKARSTLELCEEYGAQYVRVEDCGVWSRSRCLNVGIRNVRTKFLIASDADIMFSPSYLSDVIGMLKDSPLSVVCSAMLDLPQESTGILREVAGVGGDLHTEQWKEWCLARQIRNGGFHPSILATYAAFYRFIRGYDEYYEVWGSEDDDLLRRFERLGLEPRSLDSGSYYLHQWHPKFEGVLEGNTMEQIERNRAHFRKNRSILRNGPNWGLR